MNITDILFIGLFIIIGFVQIYYSIKLFKDIQLIRNSDEISINEAVNRDDIVQVNGVAKKYKNILNSPLENEECFAYEYKVEERKRNRRRNRRRKRNKWKTIESGEDAVDFIVDDNSGTAYIHTDNAKTSLDENTKYDMSNSSSIPTTVAKNNNLSFDLMGFNFGRKLRLREGTIKPSDDVFVIGKFNNTNTKNNETVEINSDESIYISNKSTKQELKSLITKYLIFKFLGIMFIIIPSGILLSELGIL